VDIFPLKVIIFAFVAQRSLAQFSAVPRPIAVQRLLMAIAVSKYSFLLALGSASLVLGLVILIFVSAFFGLSGLIWDSQAYQSQLFCISPHM
jgi:uncharacterized membrane protein